MLGGLTEKDSRFRATAVVLGIGLLSLLIVQFAVIPALLIDLDVVFNPGEAAPSAIMVMLVMNFIGLALGGVAYLVITGRSRSWLDIKIPTLRDWVWIVGGIIVLFVFYLLVGIGSTLLDVEAAESEVILLLQDDLMLVLGMIVVVWLFNAPAEEFLFRNVMQKRLYAAFSDWGAILMTSVIFMLFHIPAYIGLAESILATLVSLTVMLGGSILFGYLYLKTENLIVPTVAHAGINTIQLLIFLSTLVFDIDPDEMAMGVIVTLVGMV